MHIIWTNMSMNVSCVVFRRVIAHVFLSRLIMKFEILLCFPIQQPDVTRFHGTGALWLIVLLTMPTVIVLSICFSVGGYGCPRLFRVSQRTLASWALWKRAPDSATAADAAASLRTVQLM
jgi:hypothetical protein